MRRRIRFSQLVLLLIMVMAFGYGAKSVSAQDSPSVLYVPLIGITSVPEPLALPKGPGKVKYSYAVKNFLREVPLSNVLVSDDKCSPVKFVEGDDNRDSHLDYSETWRYSCTTNLSETTQSIASAIATANNLPAAQKAYATVIVGSDTAAPLVNIINITKVAYPLTLPSEGGDITFTYRVNNPGIVPLKDVTVTDDKCKGMSGKLGDTNGNNLLDITEVWVYNCTAHLTKTTTNTVSVEATANGLKAVGYATITVTVDTPIAQANIVPGFPTQPIPSFPLAGTEPESKMMIWEILGGILGALIVLYVLTRKGKRGKSQKYSKTFKGKGK